MTTTLTTKYAVFTRSGPVWGVGDTLEAACADAAQYLGEREEGEPWTSESVKDAAIVDRRRGFTHDLCAGECSDALAEKVGRSGGDVVFDVVGAQGSFSMLRVVLPGEVDEDAKRYA